MSLLDELKTAIRLSVDDTSLNSQLTVALDAAVEDLTNTADINSELFKDEAQIPAILRSAVICYASAEWYRNNEPEKADKLMIAYNSKKTKLMMSSAYSTYDSED